MKNNSMKSLVPIFALGLITMNPLMVQAGADDDPLLTKFMFDQLETRDSDGDNPYILSGQFWAGYDLNKLWMKVDYESVAGEVEEAEIQALYSMAVAPYWDFQMGLRSDLSIDELPGKNWAVIGFQGLAPYFFEVDSALFIGESGDIAYRFEAEYEMLLTQRLILTPEMEVNFYGQDDIVSRLGSGLSNLELGLRLRYEIRREFAPYIGVNWNKVYGNTADFAKADGATVSDTEFVLGLRAWF